MTKRVVQVLFLIAAVITCCLLAWWQWTRFRSGTGTFQNLGYALQWPLFAAFFVYAYRKYLEYDRLENEGEELILTNVNETSIDEEFLPERPKAQEAPQRRRRRADFDEEQRF
ncbi:MAG: hypothetical protein Q3972_08525 [Corynebacterium sp.]|nr:hypothetical protein [Corynebacterium sp.]